MNQAGKLGGARLREAYTRMQRLLFCNTMEDLALIVNFLSVYSHDCSVKFHPGIESDNSQDMNRNCRHHQDAPQPLFPCFQSKDVSETTHSNVEPRAF